MSCNRSTNLIVLPSFFGLRIHTVRYNRPMRQRIPVLATLYASAACVVLALFCYEFVDRPIAFWVHDHFLSEGFWIQPTTDIGPVFMYSAPPVVIMLGIRRMFGPWRHWELSVFAAASSLLIMYCIKNGLKWFFGRPWPETWIDNNPSLIRDNFYAFQWFRGGRAFGSFPSGHSTAVCSIAAVVWIAWPKARWGAALAVALMVAALVGNDYHFVGDCIAGGFLGWIGGTWIARLLGVTAPAPKIELDNPTSAAAIREMS